MPRTRLSLLTGKDAKLEAEVKQILLRVDDSEAKQKQQ
jgi:hypothetical protein